MGHRDQQPDEPGRRVSRQPGLELFDEVSEVARDSGGLGLLDGFTGQEIVEGLRSLPKCVRELRQVLPLVRGEGAVAAEMVEDGTEQPDGCVGIVKNQIGKQAVGFAGQFFAQPSLSNLAEGAVCFDAVHHGRAGVDVRLHRIGGDEALAEAVNGRARHLVERRVRSGEIAALLLREAAGQGDAKLGLDFAGRESAHESPHPDQQLARGELGEGHGGDRPGRAALGQQHGNASRHDSGLARASPGLDQEGAVVDRDSVAPGGIVRKRLSPRGHHSASQTCAASPRSAVAEASLRGR